MANEKVATGIGTTTAFKGLKTPRELLRYNLMRGVTDFSNLEQYDLYEKGYPFLVVVKAPDFLMDLADLDPNGMGVIINNYIHILENDFRGIDNIENITGEANGEITNGIRSIQLINKVTKPSNSTFTMNYYERSGSILTKAHELYLTGIKDPDTQVKTYHGLIDRYVFGSHASGLRNSGSDPGPHRECFTFMYFVTDNTMTKVERAFLICAAQPTTANFSDLYDGNKGDIQFVELGLSFNGFFINNDYVYQKAQAMLMAMRNPKNKTGSRIIVDSNNFKYKGIAEVKLDAITRENEFDIKPVWNSNGTMNDEYKSIKSTGSANSSQQSVTGDAGASVNNAGYNDYVASIEQSGGEHFVDMNGNDASAAIGNAAEAIGNAATSTVNTVSNFLDSIF